MPFMDEIVASAIDEIERHPETVVAVVLVAIVLALTGVIS